MYTSLLQTLLPSLMYLRLYQNVHLIFASTPYVKNCNSCQVPGCKFQVQTDPVIVLKL
ncbi:hypothetical protein F2Q69_00038830 [Brassica cretica]|uniref:Uncharacterized protein n=1 Tax=Brassica cretica TaxID=69181 RepID=A0A8S9SI14_BRACR|nr:hypothetical protein F2Q69_00038830 [Brassica cretica]